PFANVPYRLEVTRPDTDSTDKDAQSNVVLTDNFIYEDKTDGDGKIDVVVAPKPPDYTTDYSKSTHASVILFVNDDSATNFKGLYTQPLQWDIHLNKDNFTKYDATTFEGARQ